MMEILRFLADELKVAFVAALPLIELRGSVPLAFAMGMSPLNAFIISVIGNMLPILPFMLILRYAEPTLRRLPVIGRFLEWVFKRTMKKSDTVAKLGAIGLAIFVAVPLPTTGAYTGAILAFLLKIKYRYALPAILLGVIAAGIIVTSLVYGITYFSLPL